MKSVYQNYLFYLSYSKKPSKLSVFQTSCNDIFMNLEEDEPTVSITKSNNKYHLANACFMARLSTELIYRFKGMGSL